MDTSILIVEDEGLIALDLRKKLEQAGYSVPMIADNADEALQGVELHRPSLVLMDIRLHGPQDGIETADQIRRRFHVPVMFVTAHADRDTLERARITEPFGYIVKPFHGVDFRAQIEIALWKHKMEQKLRVSEAWLATTFRNVADALIATDSEGNVAVLNAPAAELTGWDLTEAKGKPLLEVFQVFDETTGLPVINPLEAIYDGRELGSDPCTFKLMKRGGSGFVIVEAELSANRDEGVLLGVITVFRDVTERRKADKRIRHLDKTNLMGLIATGLGKELAESQKRMRRSLKQLIALSQGNVLRLLGDVYQLSTFQQSVAEELITLGRTDAGQPVRVDLNQVLTQEEPKFRKALGAGQAVILNLEPGIPPIKADPQDLRDNLFRLVLGARDAMPEGGIVKISTTTNAQVVQVAVRDTGKGIRADAKEHVFDPYYRSRHGKANPGFSLALVHQFVALSDGSIEVESAPGDGLAYLLTFPAATIAD